MPFIPLNLLGYLKNPVVLISIISAIIIGYLYISNLNLNNDILERDVTISNLKIDLKTLKGNNQVCVNVNTENSKVVEQMEKDIREMNKQYSISISGKNKIIDRLRQDIKDLTKPIDYPETLVYKDCKIEIKTKDDNEESVFNIISTIGR